MTDRTTLEALLARVLQGTGPDRELDKAILASMGFTWRGMAYWHHDEKTMWRGSTFFTASLDAALTLVPKGWLYELHSGNDEDWAEVTLFPYLAKATFWTRAATPPRALIAACLKARMEGLGE